jgi:site-specific DNA-methyltransferase (adenine-specific)
MDPVIVVGGARVFAGDCREALKHLPDNSVDSVVTDPPYELGFMGKSWDSSGIAYDPAVWAECLRVLKPGGHLLAFGGSRTWHRLAVAVEDAGFELRDSIAWIYGSGFPKSLDVSKAIDKNLGVERQKIRVDASEVRNPKATGGGRDGVEGATRPWIEKALEVGFHEKDSDTPASPEAQQWEGWGTALKPAFEPVVVGRKPFGKGVTVAENVLAWGVGGLNIDGSRIGRAEDDVSVAGKRTATFGTQETESGGDGSGGWEQNNAGRWPANVILDEVTAGLLDEQSGNRPGATSNSSGGKEVGIFGAYGSRDKAPGYADSGGASRFFYVAKASKRDRNEGLEELEGASAGAKGNGLARVCESCGASILKPCDCLERSFVNPAVKNFHPTVKPTALMRYLIKLVTPEGGVVLDPFTGSGSTGKAALLDGFQFVGVELTEEYLPIIEGRLRWASEQVEDDGTLF